MGQLKRAAIYTRVSTADQNCERQRFELAEYAERSGVEVVAVFTETASGSKNDRAERAKVIKLAQARKIDIVICSELSRWHSSSLRSTFFHASLYRSSTKRAVGPSLVRHTFRRKHNIHF